MPIMGGGLSGNEPVPSSYRINVDPVSNQTNTGYTSSFQPRENNAGKLGDLRSSIGQNDYTHQRRSSEVESGSLERANTFTAGDFGNAKPRSPFTMQHLNDQEPSGASQYNRLGADQSSSQNKYQTKLSNVATSFG